MTTDQESVAVYDDALIEVRAYVEIARERVAAFEGISVAALEQRLLAEEYVRLERWYTWYPDYDALSPAQQLALTIAHAHAEYVAQRSVAT